MGVQCLPDNLMDVDLQRWTPWGGAIACGGTFFEFGADPVLGRSYGYVLLGRQKIHNTITLVTCYLHIHTLSRVGYYIVLQYPGGESFNHKPLRP